MSRTWKFFPPVLISCFLSSLFFSSPAMAQTAASSDRLTWNGAMRARWQGDFQKKVKARNLWQFGLRLDVTIKANDRLDFRGRIMTGEARAIATSEWEDVGNFFTRKDVIISHLYSQYRPFPSTTLILGKFPTPFFAPTEMLYDVDLSLEGLSQQFSITPGGSSTSFGLILAQSLIAQPVSGTRNVARSFLIGGQGQIRFSGSFGSGTLAAGVYAIGNADSIYVAQNRSPVLINAANSNRPDAAKKGFRSDFRMINVNGQFNRNVGARPLNLVVDYVINPGAKDERQGISGTLTYGTTRTLRSLQAGVHGFYIESDATLAAFSNIDFTQTNARGIGLTVGCQPVKNLTFNAYLYGRKYVNPASLITPAATNPLRARGRFMMTVQF